MQIVKSERYLSVLTSILRFITLDSPSRARVFKRELEEKVKGVDHFPYKYRESVHFESKEIRDMLYKGYVIPYFIDRDNEQIVIIGIAKYKDGIA